MAVTRHLEHYRTGNIDIRSADPENPCLEADIAYYQTWSGSDAPFARYSPFNYTVTLKLVVLQIDERIVGLMKQAWNLVHM